MRMLWLLLLAFSLQGDVLRDVQQIGSEATWNKYGSAAFDGAGNLCLVRTETVGEKDRILFRCREGSGWTADQRVDSGKGIESNAKLISAGNALVALWHGQRGGRFSVFARRRMGDRWQAEQKLTAPNVDALHPVVTIDSRGVVWVAYEVTKRGGFSVEVIRQQGSGWSRPLEITSPGSDRRPSLAPGRNGEVWLAWDSTREGNYDIFLSLIGGNRPEIRETIQVTADPTIDDSPSIATASDGSVWIAWNGMRGHAGDRYRADRHNGDAFVRVLRGGRLLTPPGAVPGALPGQVSFGSVVKSGHDAVDPYWHWKQTQNYPIAFVDRSDRAWIVWRTDATGAHNFDLWGRIHDGARWSEELHLTDFSPGRDEWPSAAVAPDGTVQLTWEAQVLPKPGEESRFTGGDVDAYNTLGMPNVVLTAAASAPVTGWKAAPLSAALEPVVGRRPPGRPLDREVAGDAAALAAGSQGRPGGRLPTKFNIYFGDPHSHTILSDAKTGLPDQILTVSRDDLGLDFAVVSDHSEMGRLQPSEYEELRLTAAVFDEPGKFVSLTGWEWTAGPAFGHRVILYGDQGGRPISYATAEGNTIEKLYDHVRKDHGIMSPHHTGQATWGRWNPAAHHDEDLEPNFEIASWHGRFEFYGNPWEGRRQVPGHQYQDALRRGRHVGVMGASDTHHLSPGEGGLTAVLAERLDRASIFDAIRNRRNYATTGARIILDFEGNGAPMGSRISASGPLTLRVHVEGTAAVDRVEIVRNLVDTFAAVRIEQNPSGPDGAFVVYEPREAQRINRVSSPDTRLIAFTVTDVDEIPGETSYYVRVTQADGHQAWSSPIWVSR